MTCQSKYQRFDEGSKSFEKMLSDQLDAGRRRKMKVMIEKIVGQVPTLG